MKQTLTYLQQELIKSGKKNVLKSSDKVSNYNASWQSLPSNQLVGGSKTTTEKDKPILKKDKKKKR